MNRSPASSAVPTLTDRRALGQRRDRMDAAPALFLHDEAAHEIKERLKEVNRTFAKPLVIAPQVEPWSVFGAVRSDGDDLGLGEGQSDFVLHAMSLHWASDPVGQLIQCRRALMPDGLFLGVCFGGQTLAELRTSLAEAEAEVAGGISPRVAPMAEIRDLGGLLQRAGFSLPVADSITISVEYDDIAHLARDLRGMGETNALESRQRVPTRRRLFARADQIYARNFPGQTKRLRASFELIFLTGWSPGPNQPKAKRPGSATVRLADALGTTEMDPEA